MMLVLYTGINDPPEPLKTPSKYTGLMVTMDSSVIVPVSFISQYPYP